MNAPSHPEVEAPSVEGADAVRPTGLTHLSLLRVRGADARTFLDGQLTRNVPIGEGSASPAGYCSPKGRLLASLVIWLEDDAVAMLLSRDIAVAIAKRLRMFVLRAKATIEDVTADLRLDGVVGSSALPAFAAELPVWGVARRNGITFVRYPDAGARSRWLRIASSTATGTDGTVDAATWRCLDIESGLATITAAIQDRFVPQMLNLEALGAVDFRKGCYPGQEVVARSQYLGKLKRRMALASIDAPQLPQPGSDVWMQDRNEASGLVVAAERRPDGRIALLVELPTALFASDALHAGRVDGPLLTIEALPYALPDNEVFVRPRL
jgi:folate-binding protein YgfZ